MKRCVWTRHIGRLLVSPPAGYLDTASNERRLRAGFVHALSRYPATDTMSVRTHLDSDPDIQTLELRDCGSIGTDCGVAGDSHRSGPSPA